jgi:hypothetical protein
MVPHAELCSAIDPVAVVLLVRTGGASTPLLSSLR